MLRRSPRTACANTTDPEPGLPGANQARIRLPESLGKTTVVAPGSVAGGGPTTRGTGSASTPATSQEAAAPLAAIKSTLASATRST